MRHIRPLLVVSFLLVVCMVASAVQEKKDKVVIGSTDNLENPSAKRSNEGKRDDKKIIKRIENPEDLIKLGKDEVPKPEPKKAGLIISTNAPFSKVIIDGNSVGKTDKYGFLNRVFSFSKTKVKIIVTHPDFKELETTLDLEIGKTKAVPLYLDSNFGTLVLGGLPEKAEIFVDDQKYEGGREETGQSDGGIDKNLKMELATVEKIPTGKRNLKIVHPDYQELEIPFEVKPGNTAKNFCSLPLKLAVSQLIVKAVAGYEKDLVGATVFLDDVDKGQVSPDGKKSIDEIRFKRNGNYKIRVTKHGYNDCDIDKFLTIGSNEIEVRLLLTRNSDQFDDYFLGELSKKIWNAPPEWKTEEGWLKVQGAPKLGFPNDASYRDSVVQFTLQLINGKGAAWAVRIQKESKDYGYYLFYLGGPQGRFPGLFQTYVCHNGQFDFEQPDNTVPSVLNITSTNLYTIRIVVRGNKIEHFITSEKTSVTGHEQPLGVYNDKNSIFTFGNIGFRTIDGEVVRISDFHIKPLNEGEKIADK